MVEQELAAARQTTDQEERKAHYSNAMKQIMQDYTGIYYANPYELTGINDRVQDFVPRADGQCSSLLPTTAKPLPATLL